LGLAVDDAHIRREHPGWNGGWVMVNAPECRPEALMTALRSGNFYSTCGPEFLSIEYGDGKLTVHTSPVQYVRLVGPADKGMRTGSFDGETRQEATFEFPANWAYAYLEIEDVRGRRARTNSLLVGTC
jgi:hypothetical protein